MSARVAELADALDLGSSVERRAGSIPVSRISEEAFYGKPLFFASIWHSYQTLKSIQSKTASFNLHEDINPEL